MDAAERAKKTSERTMIIMLMVLLSNPSLSSALGARMLRETRFLIAGMVAIKGKDRVES